MIMNELIQGYELTMELQAQLDQASVELCKSLVQEILSSYEKAISMAKSRVLPNLRIESPSSFTDSPGSENSQQPFKAEGKEKASKKRYKEKIVHAINSTLLHSESKAFFLFNITSMREMQKQRSISDNCCCAFRRKMQAKWTNRVKRGSGPDAEGPLDDGYSWRKYGQKEILGAKHPRGYYRCSYRDSQNCRAMKQVQRSEQNPLIFEVIYRGTHTCQRKSTPPVTPTPSFPNPNHRLIGFQTNLKVETENLPSPSFFSFPSMPIDNSTDCSFITNFNGTFVSPTTSESNYFSANLSEMVSVATSATNSPMLDMDFVFDTIELEQEFPFDAYSFFP